MKIHKINPWNFLEVSSRGAASESVAATSDDPDLTAAAMAAA
jgi:hypothetical protein